jgi:hypothetical protein
MKEEKDGKELEKKKMKKERKIIMLGLLKPLAQNSQSVSN